MAHKVCVMMTTYNPTKYLKEQIDSIYKQKDVDVTLIIRDDASNDTRCIEELKEIYPFKVVYGEENVGVADNIRLLLKYVADNKNDFDYYAYSDQDDVWLEDKLLSAITHLNSLNTEGCKLYYSNLMVVDEQLNPSHALFKKGVVKNTMGQGLSQVFLYACTSVFNKKMLEEIIRYDFKHIGFDSTLFYWGIINKSVVYEDKPHILYRQHGDNVSGVKKKGIPYIISRTKAVLGSDEQSMKEKAVYIKKCMWDYLDDEQKQQVTKVAEYNTFGERFQIILDKKIAAGYYPKDIYQFVKLLLNKY